MADTGELMDALDARAVRRNERRDFFKAAVGAAAVGAGAFAFSTRAAAQAALTDADILNFALNLEYLEAQFYLYAANGAGLPAGQQTGTGTQGAVQITAGAAAQPRKVSFQDNIIAEYAQEIAADEAAHVNFLRTQLAANAVAQPALNISGGPNGAFTAAARAAGLPVDPVAGFDPYLNDDNFLLGAYIFEDVGVTAYKGGAPLIASVDIVDAAAGILAAEAFHAGIIRSALYRRGVPTPVIATARNNVDSANRISDARDLLDGTATSSGPPVRVADDDQGISPTGTGNTAVANIVPTDANGIVFSRNTEQVHNIVYLTRAAATAGGFFPNGTNNANAALRRSGAN